MRYAAPHTVLLVLYCLVAARFSPLVHLDLEMELDIEEKMTEGNVRRVHATVGVILSIFLLVQIGSGTIIAFNEFLGHGRHVHAETTGHDVGDPSHDAGEPFSTDNALQIVHHHGGRLVQALRVILGLGALFMVLSGARIYVLARKRKGRMSNQAL
jgi:hypothetical protein